MKTTGTPTQLPPKDGIALRHLLTLHSQTMASPPAKTGEIMQVGPHQVKIEPPDIVHLRLHGDVEVEHFQAFFQAMESLAQSTSSTVYILRDARNGGVVSAATRKYIAQKADMTRVAALVTYGSSFHGRTVLTMVSKAMRLINDRVPPAAFFETEAESRSWIAAHRDKHQSPIHPLHM